MNENLLFLDLTDKFVTQMITADVALLANKCATTLMACDIHIIPLFSLKFI